LCLTPNYFMSRSGWTYAEWMAGLYDDPAGRMDRVIPVMFIDVKLPALLRCGAWQHQEGRLRCDRAAGAGNTPRPSVR
jgi:hypothetical protein